LRLGRPLSNIAMETATKVGRYEVTGELGRGGMGVVYKALDPVIGRTVAVKTIRLSEEAAGISRDQLLQRVQTEARAAGLLTHPNIVVVYDAGEDQGQFYITMELVQGKSLQAWINDGEKFPLNRMIRIMEQVCSALQFAHDRGVVHRDIKPANIMLTRDDFVKVTDFGTAKIMQFGGAEKTGAMGTPGYMSPEQIKGRGVDGRTDIFALGVVLYQMLTGKKPFIGQDIPTVLYRILNENPPAPESLDPSIHPGVSSTVMKALSKNPYERYQRCSELLEDLRSYRPGARTPARTEPLQERKITAPPALVQAPEQRKGSFSADMPKIPGLSDGASKTPEQEAAPEPRSTPGPSIVARFAPAAIGLGVVALLAFFGVRTILRSQPAASSQADPTPQTQTQSASEPAPAEAPAGPLMVTDRNPNIATFQEMATPWSFKEFRFRDASSSSYVPALLIRLPGLPAQNASYWAFASNVPFSECQYEYVQDLDKLASEYRYQAHHPMVGNPCTHTVFDPLQLKELPGNILVRGAIVQGWDTRPPFLIELRISANHIQALRLEK
jgi:eukaryotic-like serine/threonine-protein kinase